jgi:CoA:oxalate CoA-transferase
MLNTSTQGGTEGASTARNGPFSGVLVIDLTHVLNGPFGTSALADLGARVIKVERPGHGDDTRMYGPFVGDQSLYFSFVNRGKESVVLDLKDEADRAIFLNMVRRADVLAENFRPGAMERLGLSYEALSAINPRLIYASSSGFGQTGPMASWPAYDTIVQGMSGLLEATGFAEGPPVRVGTSIADLCAGLYMFAGIASALYDREVTGKGTQVDIAMFDATFAFLEHALMSWSATGAAPARLGNRHPYMAPFDVYEARDRSFVICCGNDELFEKLCVAIGRPELCADTRFASNQARLTHCDALKTTLEATLKSCDAVHWLRTIHDAGVPVGPLLDVAEAARLPQTRARNMLVEAGGVTMAGNPVKLSGYDDPTVRQGAPRLDQHGADLRKEFATGPAQERKRTATHDAALDKVILPI